MPATAPGARSARKPRKPRVIRHLGIMPQCGDHVVRIADGIAVKYYYVTRLQADFGMAFRWETFACDGGQVYDVNLGDEDTPASCDCLGHLRHAPRTVCRHVAGTRALLAAGKLS